MEFEQLLRWLHVIGAAVILGTGAGIAFFMVMAKRTGQPRIVAAVSRIVVLADALFTAPAVIAQPVTGYLLARRLGWALDEGWLVLSLALYLLAGAAWLPVIWIQVRLRNLAEVAAAAGESALPERFHTLYRLWFAAGIPAFIAVAVIFWLMLNRPEISL